MLSKKLAAVDRRRCAACGGCEKECPKGAISVHLGSYAVVNGALCVGCGRCAALCGAGCISIVEREEAGV